MVKSTKVLFCIESGIFIEKQWNYIPKSLKKPVIRHTHKVFKTKTMFQEKNPFFEESESEYFFHENLI